MPGKRSRAKTTSRQRPRSLLGRALGAIWRHPLLSGVALAATGWLLGGDSPSGLPGICSAIRS